MPLRWSVGCPASARAGYELEFDDESQDLPHGLVREGGKELWIYLVLHSKGGAAVFVDGKLRRRRDFVLEIVKASRTPEDEPPTDGPVASRGRRGAEKRLRFGTSAQAPRLTDSMSESLPDVRQATIRRLWVALPMILAGCGFSVDGQLREIARVPSPDRSEEAVLVANPDSGAFGDESMSLMLVPAGKEPATGERLLTGSHLSCSKSKTNVGIRWQDRHLVLTLDGGEITAFRNSLSIKTPSGIRFLGVRLDAPFFGPT